MEQQMRFNEGKAKLSYFFANARAMDRFVGMYDEFEWESGHGPVDCYTSAVDDIVEFLAAGPGGDFELLVAAFGTLLITLEEELSDASVTTTRGAHQLLADCPGALKALADTYVYGESKYGRGNFRKGAPITQYLDSALRHVQARLVPDTAVSEIELDPESGCYHIAHALWNLWQALDQPGYRDDRLPRVVAVPVDLPDPRNEIVGPSRAHNCYRQMEGCFCLGGSK